LVFIEAINVPEGVNVTFSQENINANGNFIVSISNLHVLNPGDHIINIKGTKGDEIHIAPITFTIFNENISAPIAIYPNQGQTGLAVNTTLSWSSDINAEQYTLEVATNPNFENITLSETTINNSFLVTGLSPTTVYYWRVIPSNRCGANNMIHFNSFQTGNYTCDVLYEASDYSDAIVEDFANATATIPIIVPNGFIIGDIKVILNITHTWVQDLTISLQGPINSNALTIKLIDQACNGEDDIVAIFDDAGNELSCGENPAISGIIIPLEALGLYSNTNAFGQWTLQVKDNYPDDGGEVSFFGLIFCMTSPPINHLTLINSSLNTTINSAEILQLNHLQAAGIFENSLIKYTLLSLPEHGTLLKDNSILQVGDTFTQLDIIHGSLVYENNIDSPTTDQFLFDVSTPDFSWLSSEMFFINIESGTLDLEENTREIFKVFPNPSNASINVMIESDHTPCKAAIYDLQGRLIYELSLTHIENIINLEKFADGVYILEVNNNQIRQTKKIILQKTRP
jgi:subtilisin-like proprotein convertase family protein